MRHPAPLKLLAEWTGHNQLRRRTESAQTLMRPDPRNQRSKEVSNDG